MNALARYLGLSLLILAAAIGWDRPAWADGPSFMGNCVNITWNAVTDPDLAGYRLYDRTSLAAQPGIIATFGSGITSATCAALGLNLGQHYLSLSAFDASGNESARGSEVPFVLVLTSAVTDLRITVINATDVTLTFTEIDGGTGTPANYDVRFATPTINWGTAASVTSGTCSTPVAGASIGATRNCTVTGLSTTTQYQFQLVSYRGVLNSGSEVFGPLSNIVTGTTGGAPPSETGRLTFCSDDFQRSNNVVLGVPWVNIAPFNLQIVSNAIQGGALARLGRELCDTVIPNDQWAEVDITANAGATAAFHGVVLRASKTAITEIRCSVSRGDSELAFIEKFVNGVRTALAVDLVNTWANGDDLRCEAHGAVFTLYQNDVLRLTATDTELTSGYAGMQSFLNTGGTLSNIVMDTFRAGGFETVGGACDCDNH